MCLDRALYVGVNPEHANEYDIVFLVGFRTSMTNGVEKKEKLRHAYLSDHYYNVW